MALHVLAHNLTRVMNIVGRQKLNRIRLNGVLNRCCARVFVLESMLLIWVVEIVLQHNPLDSRHCSYDHGTRSEIIGGCSAIRTMTGYGTAGAVSSANGKPQTDCGRGAPVHRPPRICARRWRTSSPLLQGLIFGTDNLCQSADLP
jgi:hypothetical protein